MDNPFIEVLDNRLTERDQPAIMRHALLSIPGVEPGGRYTLRLELTPDNAETAMRCLDPIWAQYGRAARNGTSG